MNHLLEQQAIIVEQALADHGVTARVSGGTLSPRLVHFALDLPRGVRLAALTPALPQLAEQLGVDAVRLAPDGESGRPTLEVPRPDPVPVRLLPLARSVAEIAPPCAATLGRDVTGAPILLRLDAPEVGPALIAGAAGAGKSALLRDIALSLALHNGPDTLRLLLIDCSGPARRGPRAGAWAELAGLPHLVGEPARDPQEARLRLRWAGRLVQARAEQAAAGEPIEGAHLVVLIDGLDALLAGPDGAAIEEAVRAIAAGRDLGIQLVAAGVDAALGDLLPWGARVIGRMPHAAAATQAAGVRGTGAEGLLGRGDVLVVLGGEVIRMQAAIASPAEAARMVALLRACAADEAATIAPTGARALAVVGGAPAQMPARPARAPMRLLKSGS
jgi:DNA segregation ATPase FtsK/SpoIIIE, S-DNA-T family